MEEGSSCLVLDDLQENCIYNILGHLPLESLFASKLVCKSWYGIITSAYFRNKHLHRLGLYTRGIIFSATVQNYNSPWPKKVFSIESKSLHPSNFLMKFMEFNKDGKSRIREYNTAFRGKITATCDGLIVLEKKLCPRRLILCNPVTKDVEDIPVGTISSGRDFYGLAAFSHASRRYYKLLHLFKKDKLRNVLGCEIMDIGSGSWRAVDVPPTKHYHLMRSPVFAMGALHWIQCVGGGDVECLVSMSLDDDEKCRTTALPPTAKTGPFFYYAFQMGEFLGFASRGQGNQFEVWILRGTDNWEKQYDIDASRVGCLTPLLYCEDDDKLILKSIESFFMYDRHSQI